MAKRAKHKKDAQLIIRINKAERDAFVALCEEEDTSAAREVRRFIRGFLKAHGQAEASDRGSGSETKEG